MRGSSPVILLRSFGARGLAKLDVFVFRLTAADRQQLHSAMRTTFIPAKASSELQNITSISSTLTLTSSIHTAPSTTTATIVFPTDHRLGDHNNVIPTNVYGVLATVISVATLAVAGMTFYWKHIKWTGPLGPKGEADVELGKHSRWDVSRKLKVTGTDNAAHSSPNRSTPPASLAIHAPETSTQHEVDVDCLNTGAGL